MDSAVTQARRALSMAWRARFSWLKVVVAMVLLVTAGAVLRSCLAVASCNELAEEADRLADGDLEWRQGLASLTYGAEDLAAKFAAAQGVAWRWADDLARDAERLATRAEHWSDQYPGWIDALVSWQEELERRASQDESDELWVSELERIDAETERWANENGVPRESARRVSQGRRERAAIMRFASFGSDEAHSTVDGENMDFADLRLTADGLRLAAVRGRLGCEL